MEQIKIGGILPASRIAMGCMRLAGAQHSVDEIMETAVDRGINFFDHANIYGRGECERIFGEYIKEHPSFRDNIILQTKCAIKPHQSYDFGKDYIIKCVDESLQRLCTDHIDVLVLHRPDVLMEPEEVALAFDCLESAGKVAHFGVSNHNPYQIELLKTAVKQPIITNQMQFSVMEAGMVTAGLNVNMKNDESYMHDAGTLEYSRIKNITIQTWSPFQAGRQKKPFIGNPDYPEINAKLEEMAEKYNSTPTGIATAWILRLPCKMQLISGSMNPTRIREICAGAEIKLEHDDWYQIYLAAGYCLP